MLFRSAYQAPPSMDFPGKSTGVDCHFLLQCIKVKSESEVAQSCLTLSDPMDCSLSGSSVHGIFQARVLERGAIAFSISISNFCEDISSLSHSIVFPISLHCSLRKAFLSLFAILGTLYSNGCIFHFALCLLLLFFSQLFVRPPQTTILPFFFNFI